MRRVLIQLAALLCALPCAAPLAVFRQRAQSLQPTEPLALTTAEKAFLDMVTVRSAKEATRIYQRHGIVRLPATLSAAESDELLATAAELQSVRRNAFGQPSKDDRYTLWLADRDSSVVPKDGDDSVLRRTLDSVPQQLSALNSEYRISLAEVVTSMPNGAAQPWHQDGAGVTLQVALCDIGLRQGPTEIKPRSFTAEYLLAATERDEWREYADAAAMLHKLQRPLYELTGAVHSALWAFLEPRLTHEQAGIVCNLIPPPVLRLVAEKGTMIMYDAAMQHRGGANVGDHPRPILAVHVRAEDGYGASQQLEQFT